MGSLIHCDFVLGWFQYHLIGIILTSYRYIGGVPAWPHNLWLTKSPPFRAVQVRDRRQWVTLVHPPPCQPSRLAIRCMSGDRKLEHSEGMGKGKLVWVSWGFSWVGWVFGNTTKPWTLRSFFWGVWGLSIVLGISTRIESLIVAMSFDFGSLLNVVMPPFSLDLFRVICCF